MKNNTEKLIKVASNICFILGLLLSIILTYKLIFCFNICESHEMVLLIAVLFSAGILGSISKEVLKKIVENLFNKYIEKNNIKDILNTIIEEVVDENETELNDDSIDMKNKNVVIVPAGKTIDKIKKTNKYLRQSNRPFKKNIKYIAFYTNKEIVGYGEIIEIIEPNNEKDYREYVLKSFNELEIKHYSSTFFVLNVKYSNLDKLLKAKTTDDLE
jgi:hypothetical protein